MKCNDFLTTLHDYFMGKLPAEVMARSDAHAKECKECGALMARAKELSCRDFVEFLDAYVAGELEPERKAVFERHLEICVDCQNYLQSYRQTMKVSAQALREQALPGIPDALVRAILAAGTRGKTGS